MLETYGEPQPEPIVPLSFFDGASDVGVLDKICIYRKKINVSTVLTGQKLGSAASSLGSGIYRVVARDFANHRQPVRHEIVVAPIDF
ncbi:hypothetical protein [Rhizobium gallicum]|uniref:hypothetical protein n=1 Tax=Rhizobium gallicum TaxID=56730 RepID=UPI001EF92693|nr:hypothetical protein [Rhizobium gallicum]ULJ72574.1 hypothetical protein L2W42_02400 [Rhizobium gallicum]